MIRKKTLYLIVPIHQKIFFCGGGVWGGTTTTGLFYKYLNIPLSLSLSLSQYIIKNNNNNWYNWYNCLVQLVQSFWNFFVGGEHTAPA